MNETLNLPDFYDITEQIADLDTVGDAIIALHGLGQSVAATNIEAPFGTDVFTDRGDTCNSLKGLASDAQFDSKIDDVASFPGSDNQFGQSEFENANAEIIF
ncbi:MAG: hypothetical protein AAB834_05150 [Patescibacteria group bacterium]